MWKKDGKKLQMHLELRTRAKLYYKYWIYYSKLKTRKVLNYYESSLDSA